MASSKTYHLEFPVGSVTLNEEQHKIVTADPLEHQRILAAAGSGKTTTITARIAWLLTTNPRLSADQIVLLTFSRNAAREMLGRIRNLIGPVSVWAGTFHGLANQILTSMGETSNSKHFFIDELPVRWNQWLKTDKGRKWVGKLRYIVVDEFQDINSIQWRLLESMRHIGARIILVGDDAQNIYTWRGSSTNFLLDFHKVVPTVSDYQLKQNYRSTEAVVSVANRVMRGIPTLPWKEQMVAYRKGGTKPDVLFFWRLSDELTWLSKTIWDIHKTDPNGTIAVLSRNNVDLYRAEEILLQHAVKTRFLSMERADNTDHLEAHHSNTKQKGFVDLATFHGSKGLEWDYVFLISLSDDSLPGKKGPADIIGERRLFYVACTRARFKLFLTYHGNERCLSRFVREIGYRLLTFHGLAKYALSEFEIGGFCPSLQSVLDGLDGDEWQLVRQRNLLPWNETTTLSPITDKRLFSSGEVWKLPVWADVKDFEAFMRLWIKRYCLQARGWKEPYTDPLRERMIFTIRIFQEDVEFWSLWREEFDLMVRHFFKDLVQMIPADYSDIEAWAKQRGLPWTQEDIVKTTIIIAKIRGQMRPLRFEPYSLDEFTLGPVKVAVPAEHRIDSLRAWRKFVNKAIPWKECLYEIWKLACLEQVAKGRNAGLFRAGAMKDVLNDCIPFLERLEKVLQDLITSFEGQDIKVNPEVIPDDLSAIGSDILVGDTLVRICGEKRPDMYMWTETWLSAYLFCTYGICQPIKTIQILHPFHGIVWSFSCGDLRKAKELYGTLLDIWNSKQ